MYRYRLEITPDERLQNNCMDVVLGVSHNITQPQKWILEKIWDEKNENEPYVNYISYFISLIENNMLSLSKKGIYSQNISLTIIYEYQEQCNFELSPQEMLFIGKTGISLNLVFKEKR